MEQLRKPSGLNHVVDDDVILGLRVGAGDDYLPLGRPGHQIVSQEHLIA
jgi:hypothetical protein